MSCFLRAAGEKFDVDQFVATCELEPSKVWRKGEPRLPKSRPDGPRCEDSGANFEVSSADFSELKVQFEDARVFFQKNQKILRRLRNYPGVDRVTVDFGAEIHPPGWCWFTFPPDLLVLIGSLNVSLMLSVYPVDDESDTEP